MKNIYLILRVVVILIYPAIFITCSSDDSPQPEPEKQEEVIKTYKVGSGLGLDINTIDTKASSLPILEGKKVYKYEDNGIIIFDEEAENKRSISGEYKSDKLFIIGKTEDNIWSALTCKVDNSVKDTVFFNFWVDVRSVAGEVKDFTFRNQSNEKIIVPIENEIYYSSISESNISMTQDPAWLPTPNGEATYKPYIESNYFRAKNCALGICPQGNPMIGRDIIREDQNNNLTILLERLTAIFTVRVVFTNQTKPLSEEDWGSIFSSYGKPEDWCTASYLTDFPVGYNLEQREYTERGIVGLHDTNYPVFNHELIYFFVNDDTPATQEMTYVSGSKMKPRVFYYNEDKDPRVNVAIYYNKDKDDEELRIASIAAPQFSSNQHWTLHLYVDAQQMLDTDPVPRLRSANDDDLPKIPIQSYSWELN